MGYSVMASFLNMESKDQMFDFLKENYKDANTLTGKTYYNFARGPTDDLSYAPKKGFFLGFDYNTSGFEREYAFQLCSWMAKTAGKTTKFAKKELPFIVYDGIENIALCEEGITLPKTISQRVVDKYGFCSSSPAFTSFARLEFQDSKDVEEAKDIIKNELIRLTNVYKENKNGTKI